MRDPSMRNPAYLSLTDQQLSEIDELCDRFEQEMVDGKHPRIETFLAESPKAAHDGLLGELLAMELEYRTQQGDAPKLADYVQRFPQQESIVEGVIRGGDATQFPSVDTLSDPVNVLPSLENFRLIEEIGRGGMGVVWLAEQDKPVKRRVALKLIKSELSSKEVIARFDAEKHALSLMEHQNIARVLDAGTANDGRPYFVMELVDGIPINQYCDDNKLSVDERLKLFVPVCKAVQHAHQKGIIHRDLKPSNVLVADIDGEAVPKVIDFGLAKAVEKNLTDETMLTEFGKVVGTIQYMSPEQAELKAVDAEDVDTRTDVYSLGVMLYELMTGSTPLDKDLLGRNALLKLLEMIREEDPPRPSNRLSSTSNEVSSEVSDLRRVHPARLQRLLQGELDWVVMKALEKDRDRRYQSASDLGQDIAGYLAGDAVAARPPSTWYQVQKFARRHRGLVASMLSVGVALIAGIAGTSYGLIRANLKASEAAHQRIIAENKTHEAVEERSNAKASERRALNSRDEARSNELRAVEAEDLASTEAQRARHAEAASMFQLAVARYDAARAVEARSLLNLIPHQYRDNFEWHYCNRQFQGSDITCYGHSKQVYEVAFTPDGKQMVSTGKGGTIRLWDAATGHQLGTLEAHEGQVLALAVSPDGSRIASAGADRLIRLWDTGSREIARTINGHTAMSGLAFSPNGNRIAAACEDNTVKVWSTESGNAIISATGHTGAVLGVAFSPDGERIASSSDRDGTVRVWDSRSGDMIKIVRQGWPNTRRLTFSPGGTRLATISYGRYSLWDTETWDLIEEVRAHDRVVRCVAFSPDGSQFATAGDTTEIKLWETRSGRLLTTLSGHAKTVWDIAFSPDGSRLVSCSDDKTVKVWNTQGGNDLVLTGSSGRVYCVAFSSDGKQLASGSDTVTLRNAQTGATKFRLTGHTAEVGEVSFSPDGMQLASAADDNTIRLWDTGTGEEAAVLRGHTSWVTGVAHSPDGTRVASSSRDGTIKLWDARSYEETATITGHRGIVYCVAFSPDGACLASAGLDNTVKLWDVRTGREIRTFIGHTALVRTLAFDQRGKRLVSAGYDTKIRLWDVASGDQITTAHRSSGAIFRIAFSPDGERFSTACTDNIVHLFDAHDGREVMTLSPGKEGASSVRFSPDGTRLAAGAGQGVRIWDAPRKHETSLLSGHTDTVKRVTFSADGAQLFSESDNEKLIWDVATQVEIPDAQWELPEAITQTSSNGRWFATAEGNNVVLVDLEFKNLPNEKALREAKARFDRFWHQNRALASKKSENWYAAVFHYGMLMKHDPEQATYYDGLQSSHQQLVLQFEPKELDIKLHLPMVVKQSLELPRGDNLPEITVGEARETNSAIWQRVSMPDAFEQAPLTDSELTQYRELVRQQPRDIYYNTLATAEYRMGNFQEAIAAALRSVELSPQVFPGDYAILAMSHSELGETEKANAYGEKFRESMKLEKSKDDEDCVSFAIEVESTLYVPEE